MLNGISRGEIIGQSFGSEKLLYSVAQGMDAVKVGNTLAYQQMGMICFGDMQPSEVSEKVKTVARFFDQISLPYEVSENMLKRFWSKFLMNVGVNQTAALFECGFGGIQKDGMFRDTMISAMKEVIVLSESENINFTQSDLYY